jgi:hypothetical protein
VAILVGIGIGIVVLLGATGLAVFTLGFGLPEAWVQGLTTAGGQVVLGVLGAAFLGTAALLSMNLAERLRTRRVVRRPGTRGDIAISPGAVRQLATGFLAREFALPRFRVGLIPASEGLSLRVLVWLPPGEEAMSLAERVQSLLAQEVEAKTGLPVHSVSVAIRGASAGQGPKPPAGA